MKFIEELKSDKEKRNKFVGILMLIASLILIAYILKMLFFDTGEEGEKNISTNETTVEEQGYPQSQEHPNLVSDDRLKYDIPEEILERIDVNEFDKVMRNFLDENNLWTKNTKIQSDYTLTENFKTGELEFRLKISNFNENVILVKVKGDKIELNYF